MILCKAAKRVFAIGSMTARRFETEITGTYRKIFTLNGKKRTKNKRRAFIVLGRLGKLKKLENGENVITRKDVADMAGVGKTTVTRVMTGNGYVSEENRKKILAAIEKLNYIPNNIAKNLNKKYCNIVAVLVEDLTNPYYLQIISAMTEKAMGAGLIVSVVSINKKNINSVIENLIANRVCGIINLALYSCDKKYINILKELDVFLVNLEGGNSLILNYRPGVIEVFEYLKHRGKTSVAYFAGLTRNFTENDNRYVSYLECVERYGFENSPKLIVYGNYPEESAFETGCASVREFLSRDIKTDAILCLNDVVAIGVLHELYLNKIRVPEDVSVIGCDNNIISAYTTPSLASLDIDKEGQGNIFIESTITRKRQQNYVFNAKLICRDSLID